MFRAITPSSGSALIRAYQSLNVNFNIVF